jgi:hypothetical protein
LFYGAFCRVPAGFKSEGTQGDYVAHYGHAENAQIGYRVWPQGPDIVPFLDNIDT